MAKPPSVSAFTAQHFRWAAWEKLIGQNGITIDRPYRSRHPRFPEIIYPLDYGYINGTRGTDGDEVDVFVGERHRWPHCPSADHRPPPRRP